MPWAVVGIAERGEDLAAHAEIGVIHVLVLHCFREAESDVSKVLSGHGLYPIHVYTNVLSCGFC